MENLTLNLELPFAYIAPAKLSGDFIDGGFLYSNNTEEPCPLGHTIKDEDGICVQCNPHIVKRNYSRHKAIKVNVHQLPERLAVSLEISSGTPIISSAKKSLGKWEFVKQIEVRGIKALNSALASIDSYAIQSLESDKGKEVFAAGLHLAPVELILAAFDNKKDHITKKTAFYNPISLIESTLPNDVKSFIDKHGISEELVIDGRGLKTKEYLNKMASLGALLVYNAYPCNAGGHTLRNINNTCVLCNPDKLNSEKRIRKTPELKFIESMKVDPSIVYDLKQHSDRDFKKVLSESKRLTIAIHTYPCRKCKFSIRNEAGSCLHCKRSKLKEAMGFKKAGNK